MNKSRIEWCDYTWNPVTGCLHDCPYCYARAMCRRFAGPWGLDPADPFTPTFHPERLDEWESLYKKKRRIFVGSMCDLFGEWVPKEWIDSVLRQAWRNYNHANDRCPIIAATWPPEHTFIFLTKNPRRYADFDFPPNCWLGVTVTGENDNRMLQAFLGLSLGTDHTKNVRFVSYEPIMGSINPNIINIDWLILGAMSGPGAKKYAPDPRWIADAVARCKERSIPVFMKNSIRPYWTGELVQEWPR